MDTSSYLVCHSGSIASIMELIESGKIHYNDGLFGACVTRRIDVMELLIKQGANNLERCLEHACYSNSIDIIDLLVRHGANNWNNGLYGACSGGHKHIARLMIDRGANNFNGGKEWAWYSDQREMVLYMIELGASIGDYQLETDEVEYLVKKNVTDFDYRYIQLVDKIKQAQTLTCTTCNEFLVSDLSLLISTY